MHLPTCLCPLRFAVRQPIPWVLSCGYHIFSAVRLPIASSLYLFSTPFGFLALSSLLPGTLVITALSRSWVWNHLRCTSEKLPSASPASPLLECRSDPRIPLWLGYGVTLLIPLPWSWVSLRLCGPGLEPSFPLLYANAVAKYQGDTGAAVGSKGWPCPPQPPPPATETGGPRERPPGITSLSQAPKCTSTLLPPCSRGRTTQMPCGHFPGHNKHIVHSGSLHFQDFRNY